MDERKSLRSLVGGGYSEFWHFKGRYRVCKGSRGSKKSKTMGINIPYLIMRYPLSNFLVVRKTYNTLKDSCYTVIKWGINRLGVRDLWDVKISPLEMTYKPTGQKIYFRGLDDPYKITSIDVESGYLCWAWIEEAYEVLKEEDFDTLDESIRGYIPPETGLYKQITLTFNPWSEHHWLKSRFFDVQDPDTLAITTTYKCNEWLDEADLKKFEKMKERNPRRYKVAGLGEWGVSDGLVYENWRIEDVNVLSDDFKVKHPNLKPCHGIDFGYTSDPAAILQAYIDLDSKQIFIVDEIYKTLQTNVMLAKEIKAKGWENLKFHADDAEPKSIQELSDNGIKVERAGKTKGKETIIDGVQWLQNYEIIVRPQCKNFVSEISTYHFKKDKFGKALNEPVDADNHAMDALRYGTKQYRDKNRGQWLW